MVGGDCTLPRMSRHEYHAEMGLTLIELMVALSVLAIVGTVCVVSLASGLRQQEARGAAQAMQVASGWAQVGVLWRGGKGTVSYQGGSLSVSHDSLLFGGDLGTAGPSAPCESNLARWSRADGVSLSFAGWSASPDGGGSLFFSAAGGSYRVVVRPESGFTVRSWVDSE